MEDGSKICSHCLPEAILDIIQMERCIKAVFQFYKMGDIYFQEDLIEFKRANAVTLEPPVENGMMVVNPPYGVRMGDEFFLEELYKDWSHNLKKNFAGWDVWMLSGDPQWTRFLKMKAEKRYPIDNGGVDCRWIHYKIKKA